MDPDTDEKFSGAAGFSDPDENSLFTQPGKATAALALRTLPSASATLDSTTLTTTPALQQGMNPWRLGYVLALALVTIMIFQFLLLSGGAQPAKA